MTDSLALSDSTVPLQQWKDIFSDLRSWVGLSSKNRAAASLHHWEVCVVREKLLMWACSIQDESACARTSSQQEDSHSKDERNERHVLRHKKKHRLWIHFLTKTKTFQRMNSVKRMTRVQINLNPLVYGQNFSIVSLHWVVNSLLLTLKISQNKQNSSWNSI